MPNSLYDPHICRWLSIDPMAENYKDITPYVFCANNPVNLIDPNGMDWYSFEARSEKDNVEKTFHYFDRKLTKEEMRESGYTYLGLTHTDDNGNYYSLLGDIKDITTDEGKLYSLIDQAIINAYTPIEQDPWSCEPPYEPTTDFSGIKNIIRIYSEVEIIFTYTRIRMQEQICIFR